MKLPLLAAVLLLLLPNVTAAQQQPEEVWTQFSKKQRGDNNYTYGYKDAAGHIRIPAQFGNFTNAQKFRHIMAVSESATLKDYYLLKNGRQVGRDSVYVFDFTFDCESEGKIRFRDQGTDRIGFFDGAGHAIIPAIYNYVTPFYNGLALGLLGARRKCWGGEEDTTQCEHLMWVGGRMVLINERNQVLADSLPRRLGNLNWYSLQVNAPAVDTAITRSFRAVNGDRYTFVDYQKEFTHWFYQAFLPAIRSGMAGQVQALCYPELAVAQKPFRGWPHFERPAFISKFYQPVLRLKLSSSQQAAEKMVIVSEGLNMIIFDSPRFQVFLTDCGEHFQEKYPAFSVVISELDAEGVNHYDHQMNLSFIRTAEGYRLFCVSL